MERLNQVVKRRKALRAIAIAEAIRKAMMEDEDPPKNKRILLDEMMEWVLLIFAASCGLLTAWFLFQLLKLFAEWVS